MQQTRAIPRPLTRATAVQRMRARLLRESFPRVQMFILVSLTGVAGFGASSLLLLAGLETMALRYALAMGAAYLVFLGLLWLWLHTSASDYLDFVPDGGGGGSKESPPALREDFAGGGGTFDGGGASANVDFGSDSGALDTLAEKPLSVVASAEEGAIPLVVILLAVGLLLSSLFVVWSAPVLFAEILVDALLAAGLYRRLRGLERRHWTIAALKRTVIPFVLTTLLVAAAGWGMQAYAPEARSIGAVLAR